MLEYLWALDCPGVRAADWSTQLLMTVVQKVGNGLCQPLKPLVVLVGKHNALRGKPCSDELKGNLQELIWLLLCTCRTLNHGRASCRESPALTA